MSSFACGHRHVASVKYTLNGTSYTKTREQMIPIVNDSDNTVKTQGTNGSSARVYVRKCAGDTQYLTTDPDSTKLDNLDNLSDC